MKDFDGIVEISDRSGIPGKIYNKNHVFLPSPRIQNGGISQDFQLPKLIPINSEKRLIKY
jgi:hypothetical protein